jgi:PAS domain S-box-containing protein
VFFIAELCILALLRAGQIQLASTILIITVMATVLVSAIVSSGLDHIAIFAYPIAILISGLLLGGKASLLVTAIGIAATLVMVYLKTNGLLQPGDELPASIEWAVIATVFTWMALLLVVALREIDIAMNRWRQEATERRQAQDHLARLATVVEQSSEAVLITDPRATVLYINPAFTRLFGVPAGQAIGYHASQLNPSPQAASQFKQAWLAMAQRQPFHYRICGPRLAEGEYAVQASAFPILDQAGQVINFAMIGSDISELMRAEQARERQITLLRLLHSVALACVEEADEDHLITRFTTILAGAFNCEYFGVLLFDPQAGALYLHTSYQIAPQFHETIIPLGHGIVGNVAASRRPRRVVDASRDPDFWAVIPGVRSQLSAPLLASQEAGEAAKSARVIGVVDAQSTHLGAFSEEDERLLVTLAGQLSNTIERIRARQSIQHYAQRLEILHEIDQAILQAQSPQAIAQVALERIRRMVPCRQASAALFDYQQTEAVLFVSDADPKSPHPEGRILPLSAFFNPGAAPDCKLRQVNDLQSLASQSNFDQILIRDGLRSIISVPLIASGEKIGALNLARPEPGEFSPEHLQTAQELADTLAVAFNNSRLLEATTHQAKSLTSLYETSLALSGVLDVNALLLRLTEQVQKLLNPDTILVALYDESRREISLPLAFEAGARQPELERLRLPLDQAGLTGWVITSRRCLRIGDLLTDPLPVQPRHAGRPARSWIGAPLIANGRIVGAISVQSFIPNLYTESHGRLLESLAAQVAISLENARLLEQTERRLHQLHALHSIDRAITTTIDLHQVLRVLLEKLRALLGVDAAAVLLLNPHTQVLSIAARSGFQTSALRGTHLRLGESYAGRAAQEKSIIHIEDLSREPGEFIRSALLSSEAFRDYHAVPLIAKGQVKGVLELFHRSNIQSDKDWREFLVALSTQAAIAIENASLIQDLQRSNQELAITFDTTLQGWSKALELRDQETQGHAERVTYWTELLARAMGVSDEDLGHIRRGALLHDIGKMGIPDAILQKPGPLTKDEWTVMHEHPVYAYKLLAPIPFLGPALDIPYCHHERWDGAGYPRGLQGEQIPLAARVFTVVDVWDALSSDRPYRAAWPPERVTEYLRSQAGAQFDPRVVEKFLHLLEQATGAPRKRSYLDSRLLTDL